MTKNQILLTVALTLGGVMLLLPDYRNHYPISSKILLKMWRAEGQVSPEVLRTWLKQGKINFLLVDLREEEAFRAGHIPGAVNYPLPRFQSRKFIHSLRKHPWILLYSEREGEAAVLWALLSSYGLKVKYLRGGFKAWQNTQASPKALHSKPKSEPKAKPKPKTQPKTEKTPQEEEEEEDLGC